MTTFPKDFLWSASTAATQIEGGWNADGKGESIWDTLVHDGTGKIAHGENADISIDFYHRWREDVALMKQMGLKAYRFSISWARVRLRVGAKLAPVRARARRPANPWALGLRMKRPEWSKKRRTRPTPFSSWAQLRE